MAVSGSTLNKWAPLGKQVMILVIIIINNNNNNSNKKE